MRQQIQTDQAPAAIGPYSQAIRHGNLIFTSGQIPLDPQTGDIVGEDITTQTLSLIHISEPTRPFTLSRMPSSA
mgnify:CR=1 FL=1